MPLHLQPGDGYLIAEVSGRITLAESVEGLQAIADGCRAAGLDRVVLDVRPTEGALGTVERFALGTRMAEPPFRDLRVVVLCREDQWMGDRPLENTAVNRGAHVLSTTSLEEALAWLAADRFSSPGAPPGR